MIIFPLDGSGNLKTECHEHVKRRKQNVRRNKENSGLNRRNSVPYWVEANIQELHSKESLIKTRETDEISERINEIFASFGLDETSEQSGPQRNRN